MNNKNFQRTIENFRCENCNAEVTGNGYTNHCPKCLWSKHVDVNPGDRANECGGRMEPFAIEVKGQENWIHHRCLQCGFTGRIRAAKEDSYESILEVAKGQAGR